MSRFFSSKYASLVPYTPGEQPKQLKELVKLNTNENPFPPSEKAMAYLGANLRPLNLYSDPSATELTALLAQTYGVEPEEVIVNNGSDETLNFAFMAYCDSEHPVIFPNITYGFYPVFAELNGVPYREIPLREDFSVDVSDYKKNEATIFLANPNAPTGLYLAPEEIAQICEANPDHVVVVDEAYIDFGGISCVPLIRRFRNLLVVQTFSKSRSLAGARLGFGIACKELIADLQTIRNSTNPYNINSMTLAAGIGTLLDADYTKECCSVIMDNRRYLTEELIKRGFTMPPSMANFVFAAHPDIDGEALYLALKERGILVRHFSRPEITRYNRITVGTRRQLDALLAAIDDILH